MATREERNKIYNLDQSAFEKVEAKELQEGDYISLADPGSLSRYTVARIHHLVVNDNAVVVSFYLPVGVAITSQPHLVLNVTWEGNTPVVEVVRHVSPSTKIQRGKQPS